MKTEKINYGGWPNCLRLSNGIIELVATTDVGPRIIRFGFVGEQNEFKEYADMLGKTGGKQWRIYGGHRLWYAPEHKVRTYYPDNFPVDYESRAGVLRVVQAPEKTTGIQKEIELRMAPGRPSVKVVHRLRNRGRRAVNLAPWALTVMAPGGVAILPLPPRGSHPKDLLPANTLTLWPYTDMSDPRWTWGNKYILLRSALANTGEPTGCGRLSPQKVGASVPDGWAAYAHNGHLFVKKFRYNRNVPYPDYGCNFETFTNHEMLEVETLGPLVNLKPRMAIEHTEAWFLFRDVMMPANDTDVDEHVLPKVQSVNQ